MKNRLLRLLLLFSAFGWGIFVFGVILPWGTAVNSLMGMGAGTIKYDPMLDYWLRMASGAFTGIGIFYLAVAINPHKYCNVIGLLGLLQFGEGIILLVHGLKLDLPAFPFYGDTGFCLILGAGIWLLKDETKRDSNKKIVAE